MGRQVAGDSFLRGYAKHGTKQAFTCYAATQEHAAVFKEQVKGVRPGAETRWVPFPRLREIQEIGCLFYPSPGISKLAWQRRAVGQNAFSLCGLTHTISSARALDDLLALLSGPVQAWDAVILTSTAVRDAVTKLLQPHAEYLQDRLGASRFPLPQFPVIPLGVDAEQFAPSGAARARWRQRLGIGEEDVAVLYMGRLSFHAKAHPFPMYAALQKASTETGKRIHLIQAGWFASEPIEHIFRSAMAQQAPGVVSHILDGRSPEVRETIWSAADIFCSLADNIQETFGLSPVEAMAAGLPCVVSDWNGYKDSVRHGIDGFMVPTFVPPVGLATDVAQRYAADLDDYDMYIGRVSQVTVVDIEAAASAFKVLMENPITRRSMGAAAMERARTVFDWSRIIPRYERLWEELGHLRAGHRESAARRPSHDFNLIQPDPLRLFGHYASATVSYESRVELGEGHLHDVLRNPLAQLGLQLLATQQELEHIFAELEARRTASAQELVAGLAEPRRAIALRSLMWLAKFGLIRIQP